MAVKAKPIGKYRVAQQDTLNMKRVIVEGIAIVLSILLAFAIDDWWDEQKERAEEGELLESLYTEFEANRNEAESVISILENDIQSVMSLQQLTEEEVLALPAETIEEIANSFSNPRTFDAVRGTIDSLISSGKLGMLQDSELRRALTTFLNRTDDAVGDAAFLSESSMTVWNELARIGGPWGNALGGLTDEECAVPRPPSQCYVDDALGYLPSATAQDLVNIRENNELLGHINNNKVFAMHYSVEVRLIADEIDTILRLLENSLQPNRR